MMKKRNNMSVIDELKALLESVPDAYCDFVKFGISVAETDDKRNQLIEYLKSNPDVAEKLLKQIKSGVAE